MGIVATSKVDTELAINTISVTNIIKKSNLKKERVEWNALLVSIDE